MLRNTAELYRQRVKPVAQTYSFHSGMARAERAGWGLLSSSSPHPLILFWSYLKIFIFTGLVDFLSVFYLDSIWGYDPRGHASVCRPYCRFSKMNVLCFCRKVRKKFEFLVPKGQKFKGPGTLGSIKWRCRKVFFETGSNCVGLRQYNESFRRDRSPNQNSAENKLDESVN